MEYRLGLDIGIGSIGWAVVSAEEDGHKRRIEDFGTRIFESGEKPDTKASLCQGRRGYRGVRRLERRCAFRKTLLKNHFINIGLLGSSFNDDYAACKDEDVYVLKVKALDAKLSPAELYKTLAHTCNHRGYRDFYEPDEDDEEAGKNATAANAFEKAFRESGLRTVSEFLLQEYKQGSFVKFRNRNGANAEHTLIRRNLLQEEAERILEKQKEYYPCLSTSIVAGKDAAAQAVEIIFNQRDFEDGPGNPNDPTRRYTGFLETLGACPFYSDESRGFRGTVISDVFAVVNVLSQYRYTDKEGNFNLAPEVAEEIIDTLLTNATLSIRDVETILKRHGYKVVTAAASSEKETLGKSIKYLKLAKKAVEAAGLSWSDFITEEQFDLEHPSRLHCIGELISKYQTPSRRFKEMQKEGIDSALINAFKEKKISGTAACSYHHMCDAIQAFMSGEIYGNYQAMVVKEKKAEQSTSKAYKLQPSHIDDAEIRTNRVVFKAINETRKVVNAIIEQYGSPTVIVVEVASELGASLKERDRVKKLQSTNEKNTDDDRKKIASILGIDASEVKSRQIEVYRLYNAQNGKCLYSGTCLGAIADVLRNSGHKYEVDHIIPYSLILDNTLNNKALVLTRENQRKGQRSPLMYMDAETAKAFKARVNAEYSKKGSSMSKKKYAYLLCEDIYSDESRVILEGWKSRNINDTRYITKYIAGLFERYLIFAEYKDKSKVQHVFTVKGAVSQRFRREWFRGTKWGDEKDRSTYLNHALDALVCANLTKADIELGSDAMRLQQIFRTHGKTKTDEFNDYLNRCITKMQKYYGMPEQLTRHLLANVGKIPSYIERLSDEVSVRFVDEITEAEFRKNVEEFYGYGSNGVFLYPPHIPYTSHKQDIKFNKTIGDDNLIRVIEENGEHFKISRISILKLEKKMMERLYTEDEHLRMQLTAIFEGKGEKYKLEAYLKANNLSVFRSESGQIIRRVSLKDKVSNFYYVEKSNSYIGGLKYYCVEVYINTKGETAVWGIRYVDLIKKYGRLWLKPDVLPADYKQHMEYLYPGDYFVVTDKKGGVKYRGIYHSIKKIKARLFYCSPVNIAYTVSVDKTGKEKKETSLPITVSKGDRVEKYNISLLGRLGGHIHVQNSYGVYRGEDDRP